MLATIPELADDFVLQVCLADHGELALQSDGDTAAGSIRVDFYEGTTGGEAPSATD